MYLSSAWPNTRVDTPGSIIQLSRHVCGKHVQLSCLHSCVALERKRRNFFFFPTTIAMWSEKRAKKGGLLFYDGKNRKLGRENLFCLCYIFFYFAKILYVYYGMCFSCSTKASLYGKLDFIYFPSRLSLIIWIKVWEKNQQYFHKRP